MCHGARFWLIGGSKLNSSSLFLPIVSLSTLLVSLRSFICTVWHFVLRDVSVSYIVIPENLIVLSKYGGNKIDYHRQQHIKTNMNTLIPISCPNVPRFPPVSTTPVMTKLHPRLS